MEQLLSQTASRTSICCSGSTSSSRSASRCRSERDIDKLLETILVAAKSITQRRRRHALPHDEEGNAQVRDHAQRQPRHRDGRHERACRSRSTRSACYDADGKPGTVDGRGLRGASRLLGEHRRRVYRERLRLLGHQALRREDRLPLEVVPDGPDEEPRERDHRRAAADQRARTATSGVVRRSPRPTSAWPSRSPRRRRSRSPTGC